MRAELTKLLGPHSPLGDLWPGYEARAGQLSLALEVARAFEQDDICLAEAGTGTGKTLAYLLPALMSGKKTVVSTGLKNLQDQIFEKDIPFIQKYFGDNFRVARLKGRENYLCPRYLKKALAQPGLFDSLQDEKIKLLAEAASGARHGDRPEFPFLPEDDPLWPELTAPAEKCLGQRCPELADCFLFRARRQAQAADLVLVNHHLFMADLALRQGGFGEVLPSWEAAIFDEAHLLEEAATNYFGRGVSSWSLTVLKRDLERELSALVPASAASLEPLLSVLGRRAEALASAFFPLPGEWELWTGDEPQEAGLRKFLMDFHHDLAALAEELKILAQTNEALSPLWSRGAEAAANLLFIAEAADQNYVYQAERRGRRLTLSAFPITVAPALRHNLMESGRPLVFTSATLSTGGDFSYFKERLGLWPEIEGLALDSPFDYQNRTLAYLADQLPSPNDPSFSLKAAEEIERLLALSRGRALVLFTSHKNMNFTAQWLRGRIPWPLLVQGEMSKSAILSEFKRNIPSVLLATDSFWQGVDVPGESLSAVIIEKLPFPRPDRPLVKARSRLLESQGRDPFLHYFVPEAALTLKQGLGRLMRKASDRGLLAILDSRLLKKGYGRKIQPCLPPCPRSSDLAEVAAFLKDL